MVPGICLLRTGTILNRLIVFFLTGLWHGANVTFVIWGLWHGLLMMFEQLVSFDRISGRKALRPLTRLYTLLAVCLGFVVFRAPDMASAVTYIGRMFSFSGTGADGLLYFSPYVCLILLTGVILSAPVLPWIRAKLAGVPRASHVFEVTGYVLAVPVLLLCIMQLASSTFNPFIYYNF